MLTATGTNLPQGELHAQGLAFGKVKGFDSHHELTVWLPRGAWSQLTPVLIDSHRVRLAVDLLPASPLTLSLRKRVRFGVFTANIAEPVRAMNDALTLELDAPASFRPLRPLSTQAPCDAVALDSAPKYEREEWHEGDTVLLAAGSRFPISQAPEGLIEGMVVPTEEESASVLERRGEMLRVTWSIAEGSFEGWIPKTAARPGSGGYGRGAGALAGKQGFAADVIDDTTTRCLQAVTLSVRVGAKIAELGQLEGGTPFHVTRSDANGAVVDLELDGVTLYPEAELLLTPSAWKACR